MPKGISVPVTQSGLETSINQAVKSVGPINIPATIDPTAFKNLAQPLGRVSGLATEFEKSIAASNARVLAFGASVGIINGVQNAFADLVKTGIDVQKTLADIAAITGQGGKELEKFGDQLFNVGKLTGQSFKTAAQAALEFSRQGLNAEETLKRTTDALTLTRFTSLNAAEAVDVLTAAANSFAETGITTAQIINKLVAVDTKFAVSAEDLANGLARAGSIAQEVGVNFDQLNAAITVAQERTARGGAVIGNALKTIFTRIRSDETIKALQEIGVYSRDLQGNLKPATQILTELAGKIDEFGGKKKIEVLEAVASKYNINILSALLNDLNAANSKFGEVVQISSGATTQAYERQIELNKTLSAEINNASVSVTQLLNKLAEIGVTENLSSLLKFVNGLLDSFNNLLDSEGIGGNIAKGLISGISDVFFKIGLPIIGAIFIKLTKDIAQFGLESLKTILGINQQVKERQALEQAVVNTLIRDEQVMASILSLSGNRAKQEEYLLNVYNKQLAALQQVQNIATAVAPALMQAGISATSGQIRKRAAGGYLPSQEASDVRRGVGGASASSKVVSIPNFAFGGGKRGTMIANTSEYMVPNFANGGTAIFNRDMARTYGLPAGAKKISAAGGYVPNFAKKDAGAGQYNFSQYAGLFGVTSSGGGPILESGPIYIGKDKNGRIKKLSPDEGGIPVNFEGYGVPARPGGAGKVEDIQKRVEDISRELSKGAALDFARAFGKPGLEDQKVAQSTVEKASKANQNKGAIAAFTGSIFEAAVASILEDKAFAEQQERATTALFDFQHTPDLQKYFNIPSSKKFIEAKNTVNGPNIEKIATKIYKAEVEKRDPTSQKKWKYITGIPRDEIANGTIKARVFNEGGVNYIETGYKTFERATSSDLSGYTPINQLPKGGMIKRGASGYIPNFAKDGPLEDAIQREIDAGVNPSAIRITTDGRLKNSKNPQGLAVINTRDEPNGKIPNFASPSDIRRAEDRAVKHGRASYITDRPQDRYTGGDTFDYGSGGPDPNKKGASLKDVNLGKFLALQGAVVGLTGAMQSLAEEGSTTSKSLEYISGAASTAVSGMSLAAAGFGPLGIGIGVAITAITSFAPAISKFIASLETDTDKLIKSLSKLQEEADKTGQKISPEKFLAALDEITKGAEGKKAQESVNEKVKSSLKGQGIEALDEQQLKSFRAISDVLGGIEKINLEEFTKTSSKYIATGIGGASKVTSKEIDFEKLIPAARIAALDKIANATVQTKASTGAVNTKEIEVENKLINDRLSVLNNVFKIEQSIANEAAKRTLALEKEAALLERGKGILTEQAYLAKQQAQEISKAEAQRTEASQKITAGLGERFSNIGDKAIAQKLGTLDLKSLETLTKSATNLQGNIDITSDAFKNKFQELTGVNFEQLLNIRKDVAENINQALNASKKTTDDYNNTVASISQKYKLTQTQLQKTTAETAILESILAGTVINLKGFDEPISGAAKYSEMVSQESANLTLSYKNLLLSNKKELDLADKKLQIDLDTAKASKEQADELRKRQPLNRRAELDLINLSKETETKIDQFKKDGVNAAGKFALDLKLINAESEYVNAYLKGVSTQDEIEAENKKAVIASQKARRAAEVSAGRQREIFLADIEAIDNKIQIAKAFESSVSQELLNQKAAKDLQLETLNLAAARRELAAKETNATLEYVNKREKTRIDSAKDILDKINTPNRGRVGFAAETAMSDVLLKRTQGREVNRMTQKEIDEITNGMSISDRFRIQSGTLIDQAKSFNQIIGDDAPKMFADGMAQAMQATLNQADNLGEALQGIAKSFLSSLQEAFLQSASQRIVSSVVGGIGAISGQSKGGIIRGYAGGGFVSDGSGYKDDVPAMLSNGEYVIRKSAVKKYGKDMFEKMNSGQPINLPGMANGGIFLPGVRGGSAISGYRDLTAFANQTTTSGATDVLAGTSGSAFINLEDQSQRLSRFGLLNDDTINQEIRSAQEQALNIIKEREAYRTQQRKALQQQIVGTVLSAAIAYGASKIPKATPSDPGQVNEFWDYVGKGGKAYGGLMRRYASGGSPVDDIPALLMGGEYVLSRETTNKYGKKFLDSLNRGAAPRFADGGMVGGESMADKVDKISNKLETGGASTNVSININVSQNGMAQTSVEGNSKQDGVDYKKLGDQVRAIVIEEISTQKRVGGMLRT
jgi:TP901 family phage tail tape measure protein